jgi:3',5'-nucleoside bisphosphate phosphatase
MIDLHTHTTASDGSLSFEELVAQAKAAGLKAIAITDHDTLISAIKITGKEPLEVIPGIELSVFDNKYKDIHILGLYLDPKHKALIDKLKSIKSEREDQKKAILVKLKSLGYEIPFEEVKAKAKGSIGRPHIAQVLVEKYPKEFPSIQSTFDKLLGNDKPAYMDRPIGFSLKEAISLIHSAGGLAFLAHPFVYKYDLDQMVADFEYADGDGLEVFYDYVTNQPEANLNEAQNGELIAHVRALASVGGFLMSGGSDFHGAAKGQKLGAFGAPDEILDKIRAEIE